MTEPEHVPDEPEIEAEAGTEAEAATEQAANPAPVGPLAVVAEAAPLEAPDPSAPEDGDESAAQALPAEDASGLDNVLEALLLASETPLSLDALQRLVGEDFNAGRTELRAALQRLAERLAPTSMHLHEVASGWRMQVRQEYSHWVARLYQEKPPKMSRATLETLALIVYRQPITRGEIEGVRGVAVSPNILRTLHERGWIREVGHKEVPGRPALFGTTQQFLDDFNLKSLDLLPALPEIKDVAQLDAALARLAGEVAPVEALDETADEESPQSADMTAPDVAPQDATVH